MSPKIVLNILLAGVRSTFCSLRTTLQIKFDAIVEESKRDYQLDTLSFFFIKENNKPCLSRKQKQIHRWFAPLIHTSTFK